ncbi:hypothetical protein NP493_231g03020 [Ridgeia piscesae]|uniref:Xaa-Pro aminopeptidase n=1 Tax=Ridgeia piscesae TaxID=27915 RepID=A0AAD9UDP8_RIDPI|nr:hypothetical protein NP493_231g03020 [Ridgeia piscesae]
MGDVSLTGGHTLDAYIIEKRDEYGSDGAEADNRLKFISGFSGSSGWAVVTTRAAALWTDGRYDTQADQQMDCQWTLILVAEGNLDSATWLLHVLPSGAKVGADPRLVSLASWQKYQSMLAIKMIQMVEVQADLVEHVWTSGRPPRPNNPVYVHPLSFAGENWQSKVSRLRTEMAGAHLDALVVTSLSATAWLFNLRGSDIEYSPLFYSYAIVLQEEIRLYLVNYQTMPTAKNISEHLDSACTKDRTLCVQIKEHTEALKDLRAISSNDNIFMVGISPSASYAVFLAAGEKRVVDFSPVILMKSIKNPTEQRRYMECQVRDSAALVEFAALLEEQVTAGAYWTEISAARKLAQIRSTYDFNRGISFRTISAVGENAAIIHYGPDNVTDTRIRTDRVYLLDSGGQYLDGTTDVTRTFHYGTPTDLEREAYTRVLIASIELATTVWPEGLHGNDLDARTRNILWENGWDYRHGTGHGIGYFLTVHEGPLYISVRQVPGDSPLHPGMFVSDEPGYYEHGKFGIRLENVLRIQEAHTPYHFGNSRYLGFSETTLVPYEPKFIKYEMLSVRHRRWLNAYHSRCLRETGEYLKNVRNNQHAYNWLLARVSPIPDTPYWTKLARLTSGSDVIVVSWTCLAAITALATQLLV